MAEVRLAPTARKQFDKFPKSAKLKIEKGLFKLEVNSHVGKKLVGEFSGFYSLRAWPYRIIYQLSSENLIYVVAIFHRQSAYG